MPWHDIAMLVQGNAARDVARHFIQRWNAIKEEKTRVNRAYPFLIPKSYDLKNDPVPSVFFQKGKFEKVSCQVIRSVSQWSAGVQTIEDSIQQAYVDSIHNAKHYIYIENQFFISLAAANNQVQNRIGEALFNRILQAHREGKTFRVFVVIPLLPGFEGEVGTNRGVAIHAITHWNYASIGRGNDSLLVKLSKAGVEDPGQYLTFHGLRTWSELHGDLVTELIYVHSKLLIADDNLVICGSANVNDRSMIGKRDSEVAVILQDEVEVQSKMDGSDYKAGRFARSLRMHLFREHLGLFDDHNVDITDPISDDFYNNVWLKTATLNTEIYDEVFQCIPTDKCDSFIKLQEYQDTHALTVTDSVRASKMLRDVKGHLVTLPLKFLSKENLLPAAGTGSFNPRQLWT
ncbi:Phospholipase D1 [Orchesella cincta]|uniref:phospholipase D n=1 Tax=Orchesella cincta TaxID=48709 RepID=A0A1D2NMU6_ORCCI|nr:Phospholipase D1 [Orchesella cincta]